MKTMSLLRFVRSPWPWPGATNIRPRSIESSTATAGAAPSVQQGANARSANPLNSESSPGETTGSVGGTPGGTSSAQTEPSSSNGVR